MMKIAFLCSGGGGNLRFIAEAIRLGLLNARLTAVITDRDCLANRFAEENAIPTQAIDFSEPGQTTLTRLLSESGADVVITNVHRILVAPVVEAFAGKLVNLHYSLLPAYGGMIGTRPVAAALQDGAAFTGVTAHLVDSGVDTGRPLVQSAIPLQPGDTVESIMDTVFRTGGVTLLNALLLRQGAQPQRCLALQLRGRQVFMNPCAAADKSAIDEPTWQRIADYPVSP